MTNQQVARAWAEGRPAHSGHMSTDGRNLFSYALRIGRTNSDGCKFVIDYTARAGLFRSMTTSHHVGIAQRYGHLTQYAEDEECPVPGYGRNPALDTLRHHVTGAIERGDAVAIVEQREPFDLADVDAIENGNDFTEETEALQRAIDSGMAWKLQGGYGRAAMDAIESGRCMLGEVGHRDYYGNYVPSRYEVQAGTKGSPELHAEYHAKVLLGEVK